jgi:hypothetical protein
MCFKYKHKDVHTYFVYIFIQAKALSKAWEGKHRLLLAELRHVVNNLENYMMTQVHLYKYVCVCKYVRICANDAARGIAADGK